MQGDEALERTEVTAAQPAGVPAADAPCANGRPNRSIFCHDLKKNNKTSHTPARGGLAAGPLLLCGGALRQGRPVQDTALPGASSRPSFTAKR